MELFPTPDLLDRRIPINLVYIFFFLIIVKKKKKWQKTYCSFKGFECLWTGESHWHDDGKSTLIWTNIRLGLVTAWEL